MTGRFRERDDGMTIDDLAVVRRAYAKQVLAAAAVADASLMRALAETERERFLGPGPWKLMRFGGNYVETPDADPVYLYTDDLVAIDAARGLNNGQPSFLSKLIHAARIRPGDHVVHVGTGTGYYTALMRCLAGPHGCVTGIEVDPGLAARAADNLAGYPGATVLAGDGGDTDFAPADVVFVNAGAVRPAPAWLDRLKDGGRLVLPLTVHGGDTGTRGAVFLVTRRGGAFEARHVSPTRIFPCIGGREPDGEARLADAFARGGGMDVTALHRRAPKRGDRLWLDGGDWCLTTG
ncbi:protein-L-isoaspartate O-methyltransferase [Lichenibacterium minor]|uniref:Protein-L-isoaspartate O-methyltransferase n=2 Tax=Lichenibacterium minor TaxID=2316528 RepID=A0A4Q2UCU0_9HYPH|nr:protein-L-isoaspartate O-methyltransferase [Lichenibacterium minor]